MKKVALISGHGISTDGTNDPGAVHGSYIERDIVKNIVEHCNSFLRRYVIVITDLDQGNFNLTNSIKLANDNNCVCYVSVHANSAGLSARGTEAIHHPDSLDGRQMAECIKNSVCLRLPISWRKFIPRDDAEVTRTYMPAVIWEVGFLQSASDVNIMINQAKEYGEAIAMGILDYLGLTQLYLKDLKTSSPSNLASGLYRVQAGAYKSRNGASIFSSALKNKGYDNFIKIDNGFYKVQLGAFSNKENADKLSSELRLKGIDNFIIFSDKTEQIAPENPSSDELKYFGPTEFLCKDGCGLDVEFELKKKMDLVRRDLEAQIIITSGARCPSQNSRDGGVWNSLHLSGEACDGYTPGMSKGMVDKLAELANRHGLGAGKYYSSNFVHFQLENWNFIGD